MTWLWHHHWRNLYSYGVIRVTRSSTNSYLYYFIIKLSSNVIFSSNYCNAARIQKIWHLYKIINFRKFSGASNKTVTAGLPRAAESWRFLRICQININWKSPKHSPHQFIVYHPPPLPQVEIGLNCANGTKLRNASLISCHLLRILKKKSFNFRINRSSEYDKVWIIKTNLERF